MYLCVMVAIVLKENGNCNGIDGGYIDGFWRDIEAAPLEFVGGRL